MTVGRPITAAEILANAGFMRRVALAAARGDAEAEDVAQEAWLAPIIAAPAAATVTAGPSPAGVLMAAAHKTKAAVIITALAAAATCGGVLLASSGHRRVAVAPRSSPPVRKPSVDSRIARLPSG